MVFLTRDNVLLLCLPGSKPFISSEVVCPSAWVKFEQSCYTFEPVVYQLTFEKSREHCRLMGNQPGFFMCLYKRSAALMLATVIRMFYPDSHEPSVLLWTQAFR